MWAHDWRRMFNFDPDYTDVVIDGADENITRILTDEVAKGHRKFLGLTNVSV